MEDWTSNKEVLCQRFDTEEHGWARERCRLSVWKWLQAVVLPAQKFFGKGQILWLKASNGILFGHCRSKHKTARYVRNLGEWFHCRPGYSYGYKKRMKKKEQYFLDVQSSRQKARNNARQPGTAELVDLHENVYFRKINLRKTLEISEI